MLAYENILDRSELVQMGMTARSEDFLPVTPILRTLLDCRSALQWLNVQGPTQELPDKFVESIKCLEKLGFVYRRNNKTFSLRHHRLGKVIAHESSKMARPLKLEDLLAV
jgi:hypothetical protein